MKYFVVCFFLFVFNSASLLFSFDGSENKSLNNIINLESRFSTGGRIFKPSFSDDTGKLYIFSEDSRLYIFKDTDLYKKLKLTSSILFPPAEGKDGILYCCFKDRTIRAYNRSGRHLWVRKLSALPAASPVVNSHGNIVIFLSDKSAVSFALNGRLRWKKDVEISNESSPVSSSKGLIIYNGENYQLLTDRGYIQDTPDYGRGSKYIYSAGDLFVYENNPVPDDENDRSGFSKLYSLNKQFNRKWSIIIKGNPVGIKKYKNINYILTDRGWFYKTDQKGTILKEKNIASGIYSSFLLLEKYIYLLSSAEYIKLYNHDFELKDRIPIPRKAVFGMNTAADGRSDFPDLISTGNNSMVLGGRDWILYFYNIPDSGSIRYDSAASEDYEDYKHSGSLYYIHELSKSDYYDNRLKSLSLLEELINNGGYNKYEYEIMDILYRLGSEGTAILGYNNKTENGGAVIRSRASELIFSAGTHKSLEMLRKMINAENDEYVIIKNINLLGLGGSDPGLKTYEAFKSVLENTKYDIRICYAVVTAAENIAAYHGYLPEEYSRLILGIMDIHSEDKLKNKIIRLLVKRQ